MDWSNENCPICRGPAREALPRIGDFAEIICDACGRFRISGSSMAVMQHEDDPKKRRAVLERAIQESGDKMPFIKGLAS